MQLRILSWKIYIFDQSKSLLNENHLDQNFEMSRFLDSQEFLENSREISLLDLDLEANSFHFSLSISILRNFHFTFHSRSRSQGIFISLFILEMSETDFHFTFHFSKWVNKIFISLFTSRTSNIHSRRTLLHCLSTVTDIFKGSITIAIQCIGLTFDTCIVSSTVTDISPPFDISSDQEVPTEYLCTASFDGKIISNISVDVQY